MHVSLVLVSLLCARLMLVALLLCENQHQKMAMLYYMKNHITPGSRKNNFMSCTEYILVNWAKQKCKMTHYCSTVIRFEHAITRCVSNIKYVSRVFYARSSAFTLYFIFSCEFFSYEVSRKLRINVILLS